MIYQCVISELTEKDAHCALCTLISIAWLTSPFHFVGSQEFYLSSQPALAFAFVNTMTYSYAAW